MTINIYPHPSLRLPNEEVLLSELVAPDPSKEAEETEDPTKVMKETIETLFSIMYASSGCGLAAPQVGINKRVLVFNPTGSKANRHEERVYINPEIYETSASTEVEEEACLSFPGLGDKKQLEARVERFKWVRFTALNRKGAKVKRLVKGFEARVFQHEYDHLEGVCFIDRVIDEDLEDVREHCRELVEEFGEGGVL